MAPLPPFARPAPAEPGRASISVAADGAPTWPPYPPSLVRSRGAPRSASPLMAPRHGPQPPSLVPPRRSRGAPRLPTRGDGERDALRGHRQLGEAYAGRVLDGVGDGGRRRNDRRLSDAARAERSGRRRLLHDDGLDVRQVGGGRLAVVEQARLHESALVVAHQPF